MAAVAPAAAAKEGAFEGLEYNTGWGNEFASEALEGALPEGQNSPQVCPYGLYAEQLTGTAFTAPRADNRRTWFYRIRPAASHGAMKKVEYPFYKSNFGAEKVDPSQFRWKALPLPEEGASVNFIQGIKTMGGSGAPSVKTGLGIHVYSANTSMGDSAFCNADGDFLIVPQQGVLRITTEMGKLKVSPKEICVIQRGIRFSVDLDGPSRGYICEVFQGHFVVPSLGPIGANGLANPRDFKFPVAAYDDADKAFTVTQKFCGEMFEYEQGHSPFDVVAWHGNYCPFKYDLTRFNTMNSVSYDHPDPSIYTVITAQTATPGTAVCDFVIFPPRWMAMQHSFRPPYYHRNTMTEFMGMIEGCYDAKVGFEAGGASLHSCMTPHGPDKATFISASSASMDPFKFDGGLAFMFESVFMCSVTDFSLTAPHLEADYTDVWKDMPKLFDPTKKVVAAPVADSGAGGAAAGSVYDKK